APLIDDDASPKVGPLPLAADSVRDQHWAFILDRARREDDVLVMLVWRHVRRRDRKNFGPCEPGHPRNLGKLRVVADCQANTGAIDQADPCPTAGGPPGSLLTEQMHLQVVDALPVALEQDGGVRQAEAGRGRSVRKNWPSDEDCPPVGRRRSTEGRERGLLPLVGQTVARGVVAQGPASQAHPSR